MKHNLLIVLHHSEQNAPLQHRCTVSNFSESELNCFVTDFKISTAVEYWENYLGHDDFKMGADDDDGYTEQIGELIIYNPTAFYADPETGEYACITFDSDSFECYVKREPQMKPEVKHALETAGFEIMDTGGGCTAWYKKVGDEYVLITDDASANLESEFCTVGVYDSNDEEIRHTIAPVDDAARLALSIVDLPEGYGLCNDCGFIGRTGTCDKCRRGVAR